MVIWFILYLSPMESASLLPLLQIRALRFGKDKWHFPAGFEPRSFKFKHHAFFFVSFHHAVFPANVTGNWIIPFHSVDTFKSIQLLIQEDHQKTEQSFLEPNNCQNLSPATSYEDSWDCQGTEDFSFLPKWQKPSRASQIHPKDF